jgi:hypothetical protein
LPVMGARLVFHVKRPKQGLSGRRDLRRGEWRRAGVRLRKGLSAQAMRGYLIRHADKSW